MLSPQVGGNELDIDIIFQYVVYVVKFLKIKKETGGIPHIGSGPQTICLIKT